MLRFCLWAKGGSLKAINGELMRRGDIVLTTTNKPISGAIRAFTKSDISHAMICVGHYSVIDATEEGVQARNVQRMPIEDDCAVYLLRYKPALTEAQVDGIIEVIRSQIGTRYSTSEAVATKFGGAPDWSRKQFCSRLVAQAFASVECPLVPDSNYCSPEDIKQCAQLEQLKPATVPFAQEPAQGIEVDVTALMRDATNKFMASVRHLHPGLENINDVFFFLAANPVHDVMISEALATSGYLEVWRQEVMTKMPLYDVELFFSVPDPENRKMGYCKSVVERFDSETNHHRVTLETYQKFASEHKLGAFYLLVELQENVLEMHQARLNVAQAWLAKNGS